MEFKTEESAKTQEDLKESRQIAVDVQRYKYQNYKNWGFCTFCFTFPGTSSFTFSVLPWVFTYAVFAGCLYAAEHEEPDDFWTKVTYVPHALMIVPLTLLLILRTGFALYKFWEARTSLTRCYHGIQNLIQWSHLYIDREESEEQVALHHILRYLPVLAVTIKNNIVPNFYSDGNDGQKKLRDELRRHLDRKEVDILVEGCSSNRPLLVSTWIARWVVAMHKRDKLIGGTSSLTLYNSISENILEAWMAMNKVSSTPTSFPFAHLLLWMVFIWTASLPLALVDTCGAYTIFAVPIIGLLLHSVIELGDQAETPFGSGVNCLGSDMLVAAVVMDIKLLFWGHEVKLAPLDRDSAQTDAIGKMEATFTMGLDTISLEMETPPKATAEKTQAEGDSWKSQSRGPTDEEKSSAAGGDKNSFKFWSEGEHDNDSQMPSQTGPTGHSGGSTHRSAEGSNTQRSQEDVPSISARGPDGKTLGARIRSKGSD
jgi:predicted membrane chloride channel (bestrophin family)